MSTDSFKPMQFGRYELVERLAVGGMAEIFKAKSYGAHGFEKTLVVKRILPHLAAEPGFISMFIDEAKVMVQLSHPKIVQVLDFGEVDGQYFIAMEYVKGIDCLALLRRCVQRKCRPGTAIAVHIAAEVLDALDYAHNLCDAQGNPLQIIHRDISPSNIFISDQGEVKLGDFGIARAGMSGHNTEAGALKGKYGYMAPEMVSGSGIDQRADVFAVGIVLTELMIIRRLFIANSDLETLLQVRDAKLDRLDKYGQHVQPQLRHIIEAALARDPAVRYQDAASFRDALHRYLYENRRMVRNTDVRRFLERLREDDGVLIPRDKPSSSAMVRPTSLGSISTARTNEPDGRASEGIAAPARIMPRPAPASSRLAADALGGKSSWSPAPRAPSEDELSTVPPPLESLAAGVNESKIEEASSGASCKRKVLISPPPRPTPLPPGIFTNATTGNLGTDDTLAAIPDLMAASSASISGDFQAYNPDLETAEMSHDNTPNSIFTDRGKLAPSTSTTPATLKRQVKSRPPLSAEYHGELRENSLVRVLFKLALDVEKGLLVLKAGNATKEIYLVDGDPQFVSSNIREELFGQYLVQKGVLSEGELSMALAMLPRFDGKLGNVLIQLNLLRPMQVMRHLTYQVRQKLLNAFQWEKGSYQYFRGKTCEQESAPLGLDAFEIIGAGVQALPPEMLQQRLKPILNSKLRSISPTPVPPEVFRLSDQPRLVFDKLDGRHTLSVMLDRFDDRDQRLAFSQMVYLLYETDMLLLEE